MTDKDVVTCIVIMYLKFVFSSYLVIDFSFIFAHTRIETVQYFKCLYS